MVAFAVVRASLKRPEWMMLVVLVAAAPILLTCWVHGDGMGYFAMLRSAVVDRDLRLENEYAYLSTHIESDAWGTPARLLHAGPRRPGVDPTFQTPAPDPVTGRVPAYYSVGPALAWSPAYLIARGLEALGLRAGSGGGAAGYGGLGYLAIALSSLAFGIAGLILTMRLTSALAPGREAYWSTLAMAGATPLVYYLYLAPSYGHALTVLTSSVFFLDWWRSRGDPGASAWLRRGVLTGLLFLARWNDALMALPVLALELSRLYRSGGTRAGAAGLSRLASRAGLAAIGFLIAASPQLAAWQYFHGRPWVRYPVDYLTFSPAGLWGTLVSSRHGLFLWTPVAIPAVIGLILLSRRNRELAGVSLAALALLIVSNAATRDWWGGASFGMRRLVSATPLFALGLAVFLDETRLELSRASRRGGEATWLAPVFATVFSIWNLLLLAQYALGMISHSEGVSIATMTANQPEAAVRVVALIRSVIR